MASTIIPLCIRITRITDMDTTPIYHPVATRCEYLQIKTHLKIQLAALPCPPGAVHPTVTASENGENLEVLLGEVLLCKRFWCLNYLESLVSSFFVMGKRMLNRESGSTLNFI